MRKVSFLWYVRNVIVGTAIFNLPLIANIVALLISQVSGCTIGYAKPDPCLLWGINVGWLITALDRAVILYPYTHIVGWFYFLYILTRYLLSFFISEEDV